MIFLFVAFPLGQSGLFLLFTDTNECIEENEETLVCDHFCHNYIGGFYCSCRFGYLLHLDNKTCKGTGGTCLLHDIYSILL